ncbi:hypothetical protein H8356DRAFT_985244 [Neocallimastix lanati (nom. inval.)]|jgi:hypothetical protein|uniref:Uncharacterized protein n=1 Tax=Neocallimastix californiae TaxID=1754190 RepID=A0A1Y1ZHQ4_9FUNG|nr:hypothetical protein H8356DRAFT_985244 [Neocallimastix sp. JGI-2020a]ORY09790.1 hypothetical protein LY90DRAFT_708956 [Neocallimastix californiae]|eukprot:ORY09790.1 hypothetical protein LY90DRAFT_708956 [Neocallimastix californiae]
MSLLSHISKNFFSSLFGKKKTETSREIRTTEDSISESIPSFSILNRSDTSNTDYLQPSKRANIFFGNDIESNDTNEIIDYNLKKLRQPQDDVITTCIDASGELIKCDDCKIKVYSSPSLNATLTNIKTNTGITDNKDSIKDSNSSTKTKTNSELESNSDSNYIDNNSNEKPILCISSSLSHKQQQERNKSQFMYNSLDDHILENLDRNKISYNNPPPFLKINGRNSMDTIPLKRFRESESVPENFTIYNSSTMGHSFTNRNNILSHSLGATKGTFNPIPGIKTIELKKIDPNKLSVNPIPSVVKRSTIPLNSLSSSFSPKDLSAPLSTSLLAIQYDHPSLASLISDDANSNNEISDTTILLSI